MDVRQYCRESCEHQNATTPEDFIGMALAYAHTNSIMWGKPITYFNITVLASFVDARNINGIRRIPATFANGNFGASPELITRGLEMLLLHQADLTPAEFYKRFEEIHPFVDGNGRVGSLLFNLLNNSLIDPIHPPEINWG